ncbi:hypothetical protein BC939DRAFT_303455 [Gamsiella multidivaricata]|uniref:uncharacterized protein n=1 Tax=Gamsiella multidivaricata TaxID=101098 RepID=UPI00221F7955|nr:uncharacterized protein BC939DRAFT_303455 [Gamsiella multidivaricata]KAI7830236.1 hypothetical protein BC939DRAFT_303455 [Gamsiella multidivaricata]
MLPLFAPALFEPPLFHSLHLHSPRLHSLHLHSDIAAHLSTVLSLFVCCSVSFLSLISSLSISVALPSLLPTFRRAFLDFVHRRVSRTSTLAGFPVFFVLFVFFFSPYFFFRILF